MTDAEIEDLIQRFRDLTSCTRDEAKEVLELARIRPENDDDRDFETCLEDMLNWI